MLDMGSEKVVMAYLADSLKEMAHNVKVHPDGLEFFLLDTDFFEAGSATPNPQFIQNMERVKSLTTGLEDGKLELTSFLFNQSVVGSQPELAHKVASERLDLMKAKIDSSLEHSSIDVKGKTSVEDKKDWVEGQAKRPNGLIYVRILQKEVKSNGNKPRKIETLFGNTNTDMSVYDNFVKQISNTKKKSTEEKNAIQ
jgi:chemotaxis protein MotB